MPIDWRAAAIAVRSKYRELWSEAVERDCLRVQQWEAIRDAECAHLAMDRNFWQAVAGQLRMKREALQAENAALTAIESELRQAVIGIRDGLGYERGDSVWEAANAALRAGMETP